MTTSLPLVRAAFVALALGAVSATAAFADTTSTTGTSTDTGGWHHRHHHGDGVLSAAERAELKKDRQTVFASNPSLKSQHDALKQQFKTLKSQNATKDQFAALKTQHEALKTQMRNAIEGTIILVALASIVGIPIGMLVGVYLSEYSSGSRLAAPARFISDVLAGVPSMS